MCSLCSVLINFAGMAPRTLKRPASAMASVDEHANVDSTTPATGLSQQELAAVPTMTLQDPSIKGDSCERDIIMQRVSVS